MKIYFSLFLILFSFYGFSQQRGDRSDLNQTDRSQRTDKARTVLDDSTKTVYGMKTSKYMLKRDLFRNDSNYHSLDSSLTDFEKVYDDEKSNMTVQSLGNIGTPLFDIYNFNSNDFALTSGLNSLDKYYERSSTPKFYDTKSPLIDLSLFFGGNGRSLVDFVFSRNINPNWNVGFDIHRISADKQVAATKTKGDKNISSSLFKLFTYHNSKDKKLTLYSDYVSFKHSIFGSGGVDIDVESLPLDFFIYNDFETRLKQIENIEKRSRFNTLLNYKIVDGLEVYNDITLYNQGLFYNDDNFLENSPYYENYLLNQNFTADSIKLKSFNNRVGLRGFIKNMSYDVFANYRNISFRYSDDSKSENLNRLYVGGNINYTKNKLKLDGELKIKTSGDYSLRGDLDLGPINISYYSSLHEPSIFFRKHSSNHFNWQNDFKSSFVNVLGGSLLLENEFISFEPFLKIISVNDYMYLSEQRSPEQFEDLIFNNQFGINFKVSLFNKMVNLESRYTYSVLSESSENVINIPDHHIYSRFYYSGKWFDNSIPIQFGMNAYYRSEYFGNGYEPILQSYYVQNSFMLDDYLRYNLFFNMQIKNLRISLKMTHFNQFDKFDGYFVTPYYPGQKKVLDLGVRWYFFN
jgi:hypothetical protein